jgi:hypothetical protein
MDLSIYILFDLYLIRFYDKPIFKKFGKDQFRLHVNYELYQIDMNQNRIISYIKSKWMNVKLWHIVIYNIL